MRIARKHYRAFANKVRCCTHYVDTPVPEAKHKSATSNVTFRALNMKTRRKMCKACAFLEAPCRHGCAGSTNGEHCERKRLNQCSKMCAFLQAPCKHNCTGGTTNAHSNLTRCNVCAQHGNTTEKVQTCVYFCKNPVGTAVPEARAKSTAT